jgi:hypothetical protein
VTFGTARPTKKRADFPIGDWQKCAYAFNENSLHSHEEVIIFSAPAPVHVAESINQLDVTGLQEGHTSKVSLGLIYFF